MNSRTGFPIRLNELGTNHVILFRMPWRASQEEWPEICFWQNEGAFAKDGMWGGAWPDGANALKGAVRWGRGTEDLTGVSDSEKNRHFISVPLFLHQ